MIPEILFELCSRQKCDLWTDPRTDRPTSAKQYTPTSSKGGIITLKDLKTLWEKKKMLVSTLFCFAHDGFHPIKERSHHLSYIRVSDHAEMYVNRIDLKKSRTDLCPNTPLNVRNKSAQFVEIIYSRYFHKHHNHIQLRNP